VFGSEAVAVEERVDSRRSRPMGQTPMVEALGAYPTLDLNRLRFTLGAAYRTITEILAFYDRMDGLEEIDRLQHVQEWLDEAAALLFGGDAVAEWGEEAKSPEYSPFASAGEENWSDG
jgi:hypothetical protein